MPGGRAYKHPVSKAQAKFFKGKLKNVDESKLPARKKGKK